VAAQQRTDRAVAGRQISFLENAQLLRRGERPPPWAG